MELSATRKESGKMTIEEKLEKLTGIVDSLAASVVAHDDLIEAHDRQIGAMIDLAATQHSNIGMLKDQIKAHDARIAALLELAEKHAEASANLERQWQAYINTLPRH
jgi:hypothetical protein